MKVIKLKTLPEYYKHVKEGTKNFEIRKNDREFKVGDFLLLEEYDGENYTGDSIMREILYMTDYGQPAGQVVMSVQKVMME